MKNKYIKKHVLFTKDKHYYIKNFFNDNEYYVSKFKYCFAFLLISAQPRVSNITFPNNLHEGMRTAVTCIVLSGDPPITLRWLKDGHPIMEEELDASILYAGNGFVSTLTINSLAHKHNGNYSCEATNDVGTGYVSSRLVVKGNLIIIYSLTKFYFLYPN